MIRSPIASRAATTVDLGGARLSADRTPFWRRYDVAVLTGVIDGAAPLAYMAGADFGSASGGNLVAWYATTLLAKCVLLVISWRQRAHLTRLGQLFLGATSLMVCATLVAGPISLAPYLAAGGFVALLALTLLLVRPESMRRYFAAAALLVTAVAAAHIALCLTHQISSAWGRYFYFGHNQPNLGGEIEAAAALAAVFALPRRYALPVIAVLFIDMTLLEARSAILVGIAAACVKLLFNPGRQFTARRGLTLLVLGAVAVIGLMEIGAAGLLSDTLTNLLMLNDQYRGFNSGASGRSEIWALSWQLFQDSPFVGHSLGYFDSIGFIGSHNLLLFGLAQFGVTSLGFFACIVAGYLAAFSRDPYRACVLLAALPLFLFNDRLINLNPYPFLIYVMLFLPVPERVASPRPALAIRSEHRAFMGTIPR